MIVRKFVVVFTLMLLSETVLSDKGYIWTWGWTNTNPQREIEVEVKKRDYRSIKKGKCKWLWGWTNSSPQREIEVEVCRS